MACAAFSSSPIPVDPSRMILPEVHFSLLPVPVTLLVRAKDKARATVMMLFVKIRGLSVREYVLLGEAMMGLAIAALSLTVLPFRRVVAFADRPVLRPNPCESYRARIIAGVRWGVQASARRAPWRANRALRLPGCSGVGGFQPRCTMGSLRTRSEVLSRMCGCAHGGRTSSGVRVNLPSPKSPAFRIRFDRFHPPSSKLHPETPKRYISVVSV